MASLKVNRGRTLARSQALQILFQSEMRKVSVEDVLAGTAGGYGRIDLGSDAGERLRPRQERPRVDYRGVTGGNAPRRSGDGRPPRGMNDRERGRYDR